jgi:hypothetical protein
MSKLFAKVILAISIVLGGCAPRAHQVTYQVPGSGRAQLTLSNEQGGTEQAEVRLPWSETITVYDGQFLYLSAQDQGSFGVECDILLDGKPFRHSSSSGEYSIATCSGRAADG